MTRLAAHLVTPPQVEIEKNLFKQQLCKPDDETCNAEIDKFWPPIARAIFTYSETPKDICAASSEICAKSADECGNCGTFMVKCRA